MWGWAGWCIPLSLAYLISLILSTTAQTQGHIRSASQDLQSQSTEAIERSQVVAVGTPLPTAALPMGAHQGPVMVLHTFN